MFYNHKKTMKLKLIIFIAIFSVAVNAQTKPAAKKNQRPVAKAAKPVIVEPFEKATVAEMAEQCVKLETEAGNIELEFFPATSPETVRNFLQIVSKGFYDTTIFSRVVPGFVVQGGNFSTSEKWSEALAKRSKQTIKDEPSAVKHTRGVISMARSDQPDSASSHFFILVGLEAANLDGSFSAFGRVTKGMDIADKINRMDVIGEKPLKPVKLLKATVYKCVTADASKK
jgi:peptidyl-prolyl cis-trans isomerase B (cyclophilin B)